MSTQVYQLSGAGQASLPNAPISSPRDPASTDIISPAGNPYQLGQFWRNTTTGSVFEYLTAGNWVEVSQAGGGPLTSLTGDTGTAIPSAGNIKIAGTTNQITTTASGSTVTASLPSAITAPGSLTTTTSLAATTTVTAGTGITATTGNITATNGNLVFGTAGNKISTVAASNTTAAGANAFGTTTLTAGTATVSTTAITASSIVLLTRQVANSSTAIGVPTKGTVVAGTSFVINALNPTDATVQTNDVSTIGWQIIN